MMVGMTVCGRREGLGGCSLVNGSEPRDGESCSGLLGKRVANRSAQFFCLRPSDIYLVQQELQCIS